MSVTTQQRGSQQRTQTANPGVQGAAGPASLTEHAHARSAPQKPGVSSPLQRTLATSAIVVPLLGTVVAFAIALRDGIGALEIGLFSTMYVVTTLGIGAGYHRLVAHRAYRTSNTMRWLLMGAGSMAVQGPPFYWVATHRQHHALSDREGDPHSPQRHPTPWSGFLHAHLGWMVWHPGGDISTYARDLLRDRLVFRMNEQYLYWVAAGLALPALAGFALTGTAHGALLGFLWGGLVRCFFVHHAFWSVGSICHMFGRRPYQTRDLSGNVLWLGPLSFGESYQNNHHAFPSSSDHGLEWFELDLTGLVIRALGKLGLVWDIRSPTKEARRIAKERGYAATELGMNEPLGRTW